MTVIVWLAFAILTASTGYAQQQDGHAQAEQANCLAKRGANYPVGFCSTATPIPVSTPAAAQPTSTPVPVTQTVVEDTATSTPTPDLPASDEPVGGYLRPLSDPWMELALPQGRWAITYDTSLCIPPDPWTTVWLALDTDSHRPITGDDLCALAQWQWLNDTPCAMNSDGICDIEADLSFWYMLSLTPEPTPTDSPVPAPTNTPRPAPQPAVQPQVPPPPRAPVAAAPVIQTVIVEVTSVPTNTPTVSPTSTPRPSTSPAARPSASAVASRSPTTVPDVQAATIQPHPIWEWLQGWGGIAAIAGVIVLGVGGTIGVLLFMGRL